MTYEVSSGNQKKVLYLDLDQTIIAAIALDKLNTVKHPEKFKYKDFEDTYRIYERPYLQPFLTKLFKNYRVAVWTAAGISYANFIIKNFILTEDNRKLEFVMWSDHCEISEERYDHPKKLKMIDFYSKKSIILDDNEDVLEGQTRRAVDSLDFDVTRNDAKDDDFLLVKAFDTIKKKFNKL